MQKTSDNCALGAQRARLELVKTEVQHFLLRQENGPQKKIGLRTLYLEEQTEIRKAKSRW